MKFLDFSHKDRQKYSLLFNLLVIWLEIIGFIILLLSAHRIPFEYFTVDSNLLAFITSIIFVVYIMRGLEIPHWLRILKYVSTACLAITFLVVIFVLAPMYNMNYGFLLFHNELLYQHFLCPIFYILTFLIFDNFMPDSDSKVSTRKNLRDLPLKIRWFRDRSYNYTYEITSSDDKYVVLSVILYGVIMIILNLTDIVSGPYPFLRVKDQPVFASILWFIGIISSSYLVTICLRKFRKSE
ncbi:hypothetical protein IJG79_00825 [Candidatus Saccharibacteria bacterium]|nr:hypothetical protein [Candidatus Saccharibacteria bacterium]